MSGGGDAAYERAEQLAGDGQLKDAEAAYREADDEGHANAAAKLGLLLEHRGETDEARAAYERADERDDRLGAVRLGLLLAAAGDWDAAQSAWNRSEGRGQQDGGVDLEAILRRQKARPSPAAAAALTTRSVLANPVLMGAMTVLVVLVGVFLAYNANNGLPFVPTTQLKVDIASGSDLVAGDEVTEGGYRVGLVQDLKPVALRSGQVAAQLTLALSKRYGRVPVDSTVQIRPRSVLGLKFIDLHIGTSRRVFSDGATMPISHTSVPVQFEDVFDMFDAKTRSAIDENLVGFGDALAGRGSSLNDTIAGLPRLLDYLRPVSQYLAAPNTELIRFFNNLEGVAGTIAPVSETFSRLFTDMGTTFAAVSRSPTDLEQTIARSPSTEQVSTVSLRAQQPFLVDLSNLGVQLAPGTAELRDALPTFNPALEVGTRTLAKTPPLDADLQQVMQALENLAQAPGTNVAVNALTATVDTLNPMVRYLGPYQTVCDYWNYMWTYLSEHISEQTSFGFAQRALINFANPTQPNNIGTQGATAPANGGGSTSSTGGNEFAHGQVYGSAVDSSGNADCETGQRGYPMKLNHLDPQGRNLASDAHTPGNQGTTFAGAAHVPAGETFTRNPTTGPQLPNIPSNP